MLSPSHLPSVQFLPPDDHQSELQRLRLHLLQVEESYTQELLLSEDREKELRTRLAHCEEQIQHLEHQLRRKVANDGSPEAQDLLQTARRERDRALAQVSQQEDQLHQLTASVQRLQLLLDQRRRGEY